MVLVLFLSLSTMRLRNIISICLLTVYTIVMAHSFIPHHHHSEFAQTPQHCEFEKQQEHNCCEHDSHKKHVEFVSENCCLDHHHNNHSHTFCSFEEKIVLTKGISLSDLFLPSTDIEYFELAQEKLSFTDSYLPIFIHNPHCRAVQLRGPPQFS